MLARLAAAIGRLVARVRFRASAPRRPVVLLIETDGDLGFVLGAFLSDAGFAVRRRDRIRLSECTRPDVVLASIGVLPDAADDTGWLWNLRAERPSLPLLVVASGLGRSLAQALAADPHASVVLHPVSGDEYLAAVRNLLDRRAAEAA